MDLALNNLQWLICHKTKPNQTYENSYYAKHTLEQVPRGVDPLKIIDPGQLTYQLIQFCSGLMGKFRLVVDDFLKLSFGLICTFQPKKAEILILIFLNKKKSFLI